MVERPIIWPKSMIRLFLLLLDPAIRVLVVKWLDHADQIRFCLDFGRVSTTEIHPILFRFESYFSSDPFVADSIEEFDKTKKLIEKKNLHQIQNTKILTKRKIYFRYIASFVRL